MQRSVREMATLEEVLCEAQQRFLGGDGHHCQCRKCETGLFPDIPPEGSDYVGLIGPKDAWHRKYRGASSALCYIILDGVDTRHEKRLMITEACAGEYGWIVHNYIDDQDRFHTCGCGSDDRCSLVRRGHVEIKVNRPPNEPLCA